MSGAGYSASGLQTTASTADTALTVASNAAIPNRNWITEFIIADIGTPADNVFIWTAQRCTALGTNTLVTATKLDPANRIAGALCGENHSAEPTFTSAEELIEFGLNARATFRWVASPGQELVTAATAANGIGWWTDHASATTNHRVTALWKE